MLTLKNLDHRLASLVTGIEKALLEADRDKYRRQDHIQAAIKPTARLLGLLHKEMRHSKKAILKTGCTMPRCQNGGSKAAKRIRILFGTMENVCKDCYEKEVSIKEGLNKNLPADYRLDTTKWEDL